jgi:PE family/PPE-SVP subfamily C-terminal region
MSFVTAQSPALTAAATKLQHLGTAMAAQNAAAATPTSDVTPAAADGVSAMQATQFSAYGTWYQQVSRQAEAVHQMLVNTLGSNAGSYGDAESTNQATTGSNSLTGLLNSLTGGGSTAATGDSGISSNAGASIGTPFNWAQNFAAASSDMLDLAQGQYAPTGAVDATGAIGLTGDVGAAPAASPVSMGAMPVTAGAGQAASIGRLSVPPTWTVSDVSAANPSAATPTAGWTSPAPHAGQVNTLPAGAPSVASTQRGGLGAGAPRYGVKHTVMPKPTVV